VLATIERILGVKLNIKRLPGRSLDTPVSVVAIDRAREVLNWSPKTPFETGLAQTIEWTRQNRPEIDRLFR
jgi:nucleoside-diphosphate-sugar epimerase